MSAATPCDVDRLPHPAQVVWPPGMAATRVVQPRGGRCAAGNVVSLDRYRPLQAGAWCRVLSGLNANRLVRLVDGPLIALGERINWLCEPVHGSSLRRYFGDPGPDSWYVRERSRVEISEAVLVRVARRGRPPAPATDG